MSKVVLLSFLLCSSLTAFPQSPGDSSAAEETILIQPGEAMKHFIHIDPLAALSAIGLNIGVEIGITDQLSIVNSFAWGLGDYHLMSKTELKWYKHAKRSGAERYHSIGFTYKELKYNSNLSDWVKSSGKDKDYVFHKTARAITYRFGEVQQHGLFLVEVYGGVGIRYRTGTCDGLEPWEESYVGPEDMFGSFVWTCYSSWMPDIDIGVKIGYDIGRLFRHKSALLETDN